MGADREEGIADDDWMNRNTYRSGQPIDDAPVLHGLTKQAEAFLRRIPPWNAAASGKRMSAGHDQLIALLIERSPVDMGDQFIFQISDAAIKFEGVEALRDCARGQRTDFDRRVRVSCAKVSGDKRNRRHRCRYDAQPQHAPPKSSPCPRQLIMKALIVGENLPALRKQLLAYRGNSFEAMAASDERYAQIIFELADRSRQSRLGNIAGFGCPSKMSLSCCYEMREMPNEHVGELR